jgi:hypothetical protein
MMARSTLALPGWPGYSTLVHLDAPYESLFVSQRAGLLKASAPCR